MPAVSKSLSAPTTESLTDPAGIVTDTESAAATAQVSERGREWSWRVVTLESEIDALAGDWRRLLPPDAAPFLTFSWVRAWYRHYADAYDEPVVFVVFSGGAPAAILPAYRKGRQIRLAGDLVCDYQDVITTRPETARICLELFLRWIRCHRRGCEAVFEKLSSRGCLFAALKEPRVGENRMFAFRRRYGPCPYIDLPDTLDAYLARLPRKLRSDLRRALKRMDRELPGTEVANRRDCGISSAELDAAADFHVKTFRKEGLSPLADARLVSLLREIAPMEEVGLRLSTLSLGPVSIAIDFGFSRGGTYYGYLTGFDSAYGRLSPGKCLLLRRLEWWAREDGIRVVDCLCGGEPYKMGLTQGNRYEVRTVHLLPVSVPNAVKWSGMVVRWLVLGISNRIRRLIAANFQKADPAGQTEKKGRPAPEDRPL